MKLIAGLVLVAAACAPVMAQDVNLDFIKDAVGKRLLSSDYFASPDFKKVDVEISTNGLDGGRLDFFALGTDVLKLASAIKEHGLETDYIDVRISVPTIDKYGNDSTGDGGTITWQFSEIEKLNKDAPQYFLFELAHEVSLNRFGAEMAAAYCKKWDMRDTRYCE